MQGLHASHGATTVLDGVDVSVAEQALACVLGPSGSGKTTLLRVVAGFHRAAQGQVAVMGRIVDDGASRHVPAERRRVGYIPQEGALFPHLSVAANIGFGLPRRQRTHRVAELLDLIGMTGLASRHPHELSGGQRQRVALARALAPQPELLLLDEPFAALDATLRAQVRADVVGLLRRAGVTAILVTHDPNEAMSFADTIAVMREGRIAQAGTPEDVYRHPVDASTALALGEANLIPATFDGEQAATVFGTLPLIAPCPRQGPGVVLVRPGQIRVSRSPDAGSIQARVLAREFRGQDHRLELAVDFATDVGAPVIAYVGCSIEPPAADRVYVSVDGPTHALPGVNAQGATDVQRGTSPIAAPTPATRGTARPRTARVADVVLSGFRPSSRPEPVDGRSGADKAVTGQGG